MIKTLYISNFIVVYIIYFTRNLYCYVLMCFSLLLKNDNFSARNLSSSTVFDLDGWNKHHFIGNWMPYTRAGIFFFCLPGSPICKNFNIHHRKNKLNENYVEFYFRMGTILVIFWFFWMDNITPTPTSPLANFFISILEKKNDIEFYFRMGTVLVIFSFFWTDKDLVNAPAPPVVPPTETLSQLCTYLGA